MPKLRKAAWSKNIPKNAEIIIPQSGLPKIFKVTAKGKVKAAVAAAKAKADKNFAKTTVFSVTGSVRRTSQVFVLFSSLKRFIVKAGRKKRNKNGKTEKSGSRLA